MKTRIVFFGTPTFAVPFLQLLASNKKYEIVSVVTQQDKPTGRKYLLTKPEIKLAAENLALPVLQFSTFKDETAVHTLRALDADLFVVVAYGKIIPRSVLDLPKKGCLNVHPSLLPLYRGPAPIQNALLRGDTKTGVSIMLLDEGMDTGPLLAQETIPIHVDETFTQLEQNILSFAPSFLDQTIERYLTQKIKPMQQDNSKATVTHLLERKDGKIDWRMDAKKIDRKIRAFETWPGTWFEWNEQGINVRIYIKQAQYTQERSDKQIGTCSVADNNVFVVCGNKSVLQLKNIQPEGKKVMTAIDYIRGHQSFLTTTLV